MNTYNFLCSIAACTNLILYTKWFIGCVFLSLRCLGFLFWVRTLGWEIRFILRGFVTNYRCLTRQQSKKYLDFGKILDFLISRIALSRPDSEPTRKVLQDVVKTSSFRCKESLPIRFQQKASMSYH